MKKFESNWAKLVLSGTILILIYKLLNNFSDITGAFTTLLDVFFPVILGTVIAFFLSKPCEKLEGLLLKTNSEFIRKKALLISVISLYTLIILIVFLLFKYLAPRIYKNIEDFAANIPAYYKTISNFITENEYLSGFDFGDLGKKLSAMFNISQLNKYIGIISGIANSFISFFLSVILSIYMILEKRNIFSFFTKLSKRILPEKHRNFIYAYSRKSIDLFYSYFSGLAIDAVLVGIVCTIFFSIMKIPYALLLGIVVAFGNLVPFFGPIVSNIIIFVISAVTSGPFKALWVILFQIVFGQIDGNIIQPRILSNSTGISPLLVLISVVVFGELFGFIGMIVGVPLFAVIKDIITDYLDDGKLNISSVNK